jgi:hypothetical protein
MVYGGMGMLIGLAAMAILGGVAAIVGAAGKSGPAIPILMGIGALVFCIMFILGLPRMIAGFGLLHYREWARILCLILSALGLVDIPFGTALGIYGLWVLTARETTRLFEPQAHAAAG